MSAFCFVLSNQGVCLLIFWLRITMMMINMCEIFLHISIQLTGIILTKMPAILKLRNYLKRLHILIVYCLTQKREGNMTALDLRSLSYCSSHVNPFYVFLFQYFLQYENKNMVCDIEEIYVIGMGKVANC